MRVRVKSFATQGRGQEDPLDPGANSLLLFDPEPEKNVERVGSPPRFKCSRDFNLQSRMHRTVLSIQSPANENLLSAWLPLPQNQNQNQTQTTSANAARTCVTHAVSLTLSITTLLPSSVSKAWSTRSQAQLHGVLQESSAWRFDRCSSIVIWIEQQQCEFEDRRSNASGYTLNKKRKEKRKRKRKRQSASGEWRVGSWELVNWHYAGERSLTGLRSSFRFLFRFGVPS